MAERLASIDKKILLIDKRCHIGGNAYDYYNSSEVLVHKYGPHYFRTNHKEVIDYLSKFTKWRPYEYRVRSYVDKKLYPLPINRDTLNKFFDINLETKKEVETFLDSKRIKIENPINLEEEVLSKVGEEIYEFFFKNYTIKQWGIDPKKLAPSVSERIPIRTNTDDRYFTDKYQAMPEKGYFKLFENMLKNKNITLRLNTSFDDIT